MTARQVVVEEAEDQNDPVQTSLERIETLLDQQQAGSQSEYARLGFALHTTGSWIESRFHSGPDDHAKGDYFIGKFFGSYEGKGHPLAGYVCSRETSVEGLQHWRPGSGAFWNAQLIVIEGVGHEMFAENPAASLAPVRTHLSQQNGAFEQERTTP